MHSRTAIRNRVVTILSAHPDLTALFVSRGRPASESRAPFGEVVITSETASKRMDYISELRVLDLRISLVVKAVSGADAELDALAEVVENLMAADQTLSGLCEKQEYKGAQFDFEGGAVSDVASVELRYSVEYIYEPAQAFDDLVMVAIGIDMASPRNEPQVPSEPDGQIDARVTIDNLDA